MDGDNVDANRYKTAVAHAQESGLENVYWLGPELEVQTVVFDSIAGFYPEGVAGDPVGGVQLAYFNRENFRGRLEITTLSPSDWARVEDKVRNPPQPPIRSEKVVIGGREGDLIATIALGRDPNGLKLVIDFGDSFVIAQTNVAIAAGGRDVNPLMDEDTFLAVMEELRPYPE
ncbi:MAG: hypothetical protein WEC75_03295 [Dehalococcoidia bacterium]